MYHTLEEKIIPTYYEKDKNGISKKWVEIMKNSIITTGGKYMVAEDGTRVTIQPGTTRTYVIYTKI